MRINVFNKGQEVASLYHADNSLDHEQQTAVVRAQCGTQWDEFKSHPTRAGLKTIPEMTPEELAEFKRRGHEKLNKT